MSNFKVTIVISPQSLTFLVNVHDFLYNIKYKYSFERAMLASAHVGILVSESIFCLIRNDCQITCSFYFHKSPELDKLNNCLSTALSIFRDIKGHLEKSDKIELSWSVNKPNHFDDFKEKAIQDMNYSLVSA